ncbi:MAG TPA: transcription termination/antitermination protein NusA [Candidatus Azoamicus sp.]
MSLKSIINLISNEKGISKEIIFNAVKETILDITKKRYKILSLEVVVDIHGHYKIYAAYNVILSFKYNISLKEPFKTLPLSYINQYNLKIKLGDKIRKEIKVKKFNRGDILFAKGIITKRVKENEEYVLLENFKDKINKVVSGIVRYVSKDFIFVNIGSRVRCILYKKDSIYKDFFRKNDRIKAFFKEVLYRNSGPEIVISRTCDSFLLELLKTEVPEIKNGLINVMGIVRDPGNRSKVSLRSNDVKLDAIGTCIGLGGSRIQNISKQLCGEKIDLVLWDKEIIKYIINIFSDIEIKSIEMDDLSILMTIYVKKSDFFKVLDKNSQVVNFAEKLTGWTLRVLKQN